MYKEVVITIVIVILVFIGDFFSQRYTKETTEYMNGRLDELRTQILKGEKDNNQVEDMISNIRKEWEEKQDVMEYFLDHKELDEVRTQLNEIGAYAEIDKSDETIPYIDNCKGLLDSIRGKVVFEFKKIF